MYNKFDEQFLTEKLKEMGIDENHELYDQYTKDLSHTKPFDLNVTLSDDTLFYLSDNELVISAGVIHAIGDYFEVKTKYPELKPFLKANVNPFA